MESYKTSKGLTTDKLTYVGFVSDSIDDKSRKTAYHCLKTISKGVRLYLTINKKGKKLVLSCPQIYVDNVKYSCSPETIKNNPYLGFKQIYHSYEEMMDELVDDGILVKRLKHGKKSK